MPSSKMSDNGSFYQRASYTTDTFTSCIRIYEELLPYFEAETSSDGINERLLNIGGMLTTLYTELTTLKNEITSTAAAFIVGNDTVSEPSVESNSVTQVVHEHAEHNQQENSICETKTVEQKEFDKEEVLNKLPKRNWEDVGQVLAEEHQREKVDHIDTKTAQTESHSEKVHKEPTENIKKQVSGFEYKCENCKEAITVYNQDLELSIALHNQDGCCRGKPSKLSDVQKERQGEKLNLTGAQGPVRNSATFHQATFNANLTPPKTNKVYKGGVNHYNCIQPMGNVFLCTVCNKTLSGPKIFNEHLSGNYHQTCLKEFIQEMTVNGNNVSHSQSCDRISPISIEQKESVSSLDAELFKIIKNLSRSLPTQMQYMSVVKGVIMCNLCVCPVPPSVKNVRDHVLGSRHSKNQTALLSSNKSV